MGPLWGKVTCRLCSGTAAPAGALSSAVARSLKPIFESSLQSTAQAVHDGQQTVSSMCTASLTHIETMSAKALSKPGAIC